MVPVLVFLVLLKRVYDLDYGSCFDSLSLQVINRCAYGMDLRTEAKMARFDAEPAAISRKLIIGQFSIRRWSVTQYHLLSGLERATTVASWVRGTAMGPGTHIKLT